MKLKRPYKVSKPLDGFERMQGEYRDFMTKEELICTCDGAVIGSTRDPRQGNHR